MQAKITKRTVDAAGPGKIHDTEVRGFVLVVTPAGAKTYAIQYRAGSGRSAPQRRMVIGAHGVLTPDQARRLARELLAKVAQGGDPARDRQAARDAMTVAELCDLYLAEGTAHKKPSTLKADRARVEHHLKPLLGKKRVEKITRADIERLLVDVKAGKTAVPMPARRSSGSIPTGGSGVAAQCVTLMGTLLTFAVGRGLRPDNPAHGVKKPPVRKLTRFLSEAEIARLATALEAEAAGGNPYPTAAIRLLLFTGCRKGEIVDLQWDHVDFDRACLLLSDSKTGAKAVHLNPPALEVLQRLPRVAGNPHVIVGVRSGAGAGAGIDKAWRRMRRAAGIPEVRLHDLRHSFASIAVQGGASLPLIGGLLGHKHASTTARYAHLSDDPLRRVNDMVGARIEAAMAGNGKVVPLRGRS